MAQRIPEGQVTAVVYGLIKEQKYADAAKLLAEQRQVLRLLSIVSPPRRAPLTRPFVRVQASPKSRAALSLLAYCHYQLQDFAATAECYGELVNLYPEEQSYALYHAQAQHKACEYEEAMKASLVNVSSLALLVLAPDLICRFGMERWSKRRSTRKASSSCRPPLSACLGVPCCPLLVAQRMCVFSPRRYGQEDLAAARVLVEQCRPDDPDALCNHACILYSEGDFVAALAKVVVRPV